MKIYSTILVGSALIFSSLALTGCGGYAHRSEAFRRSLTVGQPQLALDKVNEALGVDKATDMPSEMDADTPLLLLERASILQALGDYKESARNFQRADKSLDVLDLTSDTAGTISKYLFSDDAVVYKSPPYEKLLINPCNIINYLALGNSSGAKVEARRFLVNRKYLDSQEDTQKRAMLAFGSYLAGVAFESAGDSTAAMRHYADAYAAGGIPTLTDAIRRLYRRTGAKDARIKELLDGLSISEKKDDKTGEIIVIVQGGMAPYKIPQRLPIGAAIVAGSSNGRGARLSPAEQRRASVLAAKGILKFVNYPKMIRSPYIPPFIQVNLNERQLVGGVAMNVEAHALRAFDEVKGSLVAAAIVRMIARAVAGEVSQAVGKRASNSGIAGLLVGLLVEGTMAAADTPDTRSWVTLPGHFYVARARVKTGTHELAVRYRGVLRRRLVRVRPGGWLVLNFSDLR